MRKSERGEKKIDPGKHQAAIDVLISQGVVESGLGGSTGRSWRLNKSYPDEYGHCNAVQAASDVLATVVCIAVCIVFRISGRVGMYAVRERVREGHESTLEG